MESEQSQAQQERGARRPQSPSHAQSRQERDARLENGPLASPKAQSLSEEISKQNKPNDAVVMQLQRQVANAYILYLNYKHYHWNTYGPLFRDLHLLFDEFAAEVLKTTDKFAERIRMIGQDPVASPTELVETASVKVAAKQGTMRDMIAEADVNLLGVIKEMRRGVRTANDQDDPGTADLFTAALQVHEKHEWWLRDILEKRDGLAV